VVYYTGKPPETQEKPRRRAPEEKKANFSRGFLRKALDFKIEI